MWPSPHNDLHRDRVERASKLFSAALAPAGSHGASSRQRRVLQGHKKPVDGLAWNSTGTKLASTSRDTTVRVWCGIDIKKDLSTQHIECLELKGHTNDVEKCSWNPQNPDQLATCSADKSVKLWDTRGSGKLLHSLGTIGMNIHIKWSPDGKYLAVSNDTNMVMLIQLDPSLKSKPHVLKSIPFTQDINAIEWEKNSERFLLGYATGTVQIIQVPSMEIVGSVPCHSTAIFALAFDTKHKYLATGAADSTVALWSTSDLVNVRSFQRLDDCIRAVSFTNDSQFLALGGKDHRIEIADVESGARVAVVETGEELGALTWHPNAPILAYSVADKIKHPGDIHLLSIVHVPQSAAVQQSHGSKTNASAKSVSGRGAPAAAVASSSSSSTAPSTQHTPMKVKQEATTTAATTTASSSHAVAASIKKELREAASGSHKKQHANANSSAAAMETD